MSLSLAEGKKDYRNRISFGKQVPKSLNFVVGRGSPKKGAGTPQRYQRKVTVCVSATKERGKKVFYKHNGIVSVQGEQKMGRGGKNFRLSFL